MYSKTFATYLVRNRVPSELRENALAVVRLVPETGILTSDRGKLAQRLRIKKALVEEAVNALKRTEPVPLLVEEDGRFLFDYPEKDVRYVEHLVNALGNGQLFFEPDKA